MGEKAQDVVESLIALGKKNILEREKEGRVPRDTSCHYKWITIYSLDDGKFNIE